MSKEKYFEIRIDFEDKKSEKKNESSTDFKIKIRFNNLNILEIMGMSKKIEEVINEIIKTKKS